LVNKTQLIEQNVSLTMVPKTCYNIDNCTKLYE